MMTTIETPPPASPEPAPPKRSGFYLSPWVLAVLGGLVLLAIGFAVGRVVDHGDHGDHGDRPFFRAGDGGGGHRGLGILLVLIVLGLIITGIVLLVRHYMTPRRETGTSAEQVLADRFARGEIDEDEFVRRRNALRT